ncbi:hypothetical protein QTL86_09245 [Cellulosilyticum sp. ST5]|uniref:hypothetical protein n=1 Tax=Cellulosilyticum sp. ST5 TaxID=3055805 RepID=UPI003977C0DE
MIQKNKLDDILLKYHVQPVGRGYIECICPMEKAILFINAISEINIEITDLSWWCFVSEGHKPCGMGGPANRYGDGWFSEIEMGNTIGFSSNEEIKDFLINEWQRSKEYRSCFVPAFCLKVPNDWNSLSLYDRTL